MQLKIHQLGNGNAFTPEITNTSFLIDDIILIDCGYNVFTKLKQMGDDTIRKIQLICITHLHDDHVGSLLSLVYYQHYILNVHPHIIIQPEFESLMHYMKEYKYPYENDYLPICFYNDSNFDWQEGKGYKIKLDDYIYHIYVIPHRNHPPINSYAYVITKVADNVYNNRVADEKKKSQPITILFTGDTKASKQYIELDKHFGCSAIFHDYSLVDRIDMSHACESDFRIYPLQFIEKCIKVHTGVDREEVYTIV